MASEEVNVKRDISPIKKARMYAALVPVFGIVPAVLNLVSNRGSQELKDVSKVSLVLALAWLVTYASLGSTGTEGGSTQISLELLKATFNSAYFAASIWLMFRLYKGKKIALPKLLNSKRHQD